jgi:hypothetical protein
MVVSEQIGFMQGQMMVPTQPIMPALDPSTGKVQRFRIRLRLFTRYAGGWVLPWLSWHFNGDTTQSVGERQTVNARARVLRAVDAIICQYAPWTREGGLYSADHGPNATFPLSAHVRGADRTLFFYRNPLLGPMLGSIFPPTKEDTRYVGSDGRIYSFWGEPLKPYSSSIAIGAKDDFEVDPSIVGQMKRANTGGSGM